MQYKRILHPPKNSFFLFGARGTGKSTWAKNAFPDALYVDLLESNTYFRLAADPALFTAQIDATPENSWVVVDEVQRLPILLNEVHRMIERSDRKFLLMGSSARKLKSAGVNLLAGRAVLREMYPFVPEELTTDFDLNRVLRYGSIPVVWNSDDPADTLQSYVETYLSQEIRAEALVRSLPAFTRFLSVTANFHGQVINVSNIARETANSRSSVEGYLSILEETLLAFRLPAYEAKIRTRERKLPKLFWIDPGLVRTAQGRSGPLTDDEKGSLFKGWFACLLRSYQKSMKAFDNIWYWSPLATTSVEVDFLVQKDNHLIAIEVKSGKNFDHRWLKGLKAISNLKQVTKRMLVYTGDQTLKYDDILVLPVNQFLQMLAQGEIQA